MTSSERKIINCLWETKEKTHIRRIAQKANVSCDYARLLCRSLARSGHIKFENDLAYLLKKGRSRFDASTSLSINPVLDSEARTRREPVERIENNEPVADEPMAVAANVTMLIPRPTSVGRDPGPSGLGTDEPAVALPANDRNDVVQQSSPQEEVPRSSTGIPVAKGDLGKNQEEGSSDDKDKDKPVSSDEELDKALADLEPPSKKEDGEKIDEPEEPEKTESAEEAEAQETGATETKPIGNPVSAAPLPARRSLGEGGESPEETAAMKKEEKQEKEDAAKPSDSSGWSFKKIAGWFAEKK